MDSVFFHLKSQKDSAFLMLQGDWTIKNVHTLTADLATLKKNLPTHLTIDPRELKKLDTAGAWLLLDWMESCKDVTIDTKAFSPDHALIFHRVKDVGKIIIPPPPKAPPKIQFLIEKLGKKTLSTLTQIYLLLAFLGDVSLSFLYGVTHPKTWRWAELSRHIEETGFNAMPIIGMMGFLISIVLAYQGAFQLRKFGAEIYTIDLVSISILREMGVLITAIMVAGRSGSAFAAEIGVMKVNEEIDALRTLGLSPIAILVLPRMMALIITLPLLTFVADMMGLLGMAILMKSNLGLSFGQCAERVREVIVFSTFATGMIKAPVFAGIIALVGCLRGMQVTSSAESVGQMTTRAVVESIVLVILTDAFFSILFTKLNI